MQQKFIDDRKEGLSRVLAALAYLAPLSREAANRQQCRGCEEIKPLSHEPWTALAI